MADADVAAALPILGAAGSRLVPPRSPRPRRGRDAASSTAPSARRRAWPSCTPPHGNAMRRDDVRRPARRSGRSAARVGRRCGGHGVVNADRPPMFRDTPASLSGCGSRQAPVAAARRRRGRGPRGCAGDAAARRSHLSHARCRSAAATATLRHLPCRDGKRRSALVVAAGCTATRRERRADRAPSQAAGHSSRPDCVTISGSGGASALLYDAADRRRLRSTRA